MKQEVNFLPLIQRRRQPLEGPQIALAVAGLVVLLLVLTVWDHVRANQLQAEVEALTERQTLANRQVQQLSGELAAARKELEEDPTVTSLRAELERRRATLAALSRSDAVQRGFSPHLEGLARRAGEGVWLQHISLRQGGQRLYLQGNALVPERVPEFIAALRAESIYAGTRFRRLAIDRTESGWVRFELATLSDNALDEDSDRNGASLAGGDRQRQTGDRSQARDMDDDDDASGQERLRQLIDAAEGEGGSP